MGLEEIRNINNGLLKLSCYKTFYTVNAIQGIFKTSNPAILAIID
jgi:hypothetical protein